MQIEIQGACLADSAPVLLHAQARAFGTGSPYAPKTAPGSPGTVPFGPHSVQLGALLPAG